MLSYKFETKESGQWVSLNSWVRPFTDGITLDESLDSGSFQLSLIERAEPLRPFSRLRITIYQDEVIKDVLNWQVFNDQVTLRRMGSLKLYDHNIQIIELTKTLERDICDSMTVTNYLGHDYGEGEFEIAEGDYDGNSAYDVTSKNIIRNPHKKDSVMIIPSCQQAINLPSNTALIKYHWPETDMIYDNQHWNYAIITTPNNKEIITEWNKPYNLLLDEKGTYKIKYKCLYIQKNFGVPGDNYNMFNMTYQIGVFDFIPSYTNWTITDVVNRLLTAGITRRVGIGSDFGNDIDKQKYIFDAEQAEKYSHVLSPEFFFTRSTLFEALMTVGGYIHAIPRLIDENLPSGQLTVRFDMLGGNDVYEKTLPPLMYQDDMINADEFCGGLDSHVENLLNTRDRIQGAITEPDRDLYKTVRTEDGKVEISADSMIISTEFPIYQIVKVECGFVNSSKIIGDITPYIYEGAEYDALSSYWGTAYPYSKGWALKYSQGDDKITGLNFKIQNTTTAGTALENYAIYNILKAKGVTLPTGFNYINLAFRVTYVPMVNSRVVEKKTLFSNSYNDNMLIYNQGGNTVECEFYGNKMKGVIARIGNTVYRRTYEFTNYEDIPKCGQIVDGMYVAVVERSFDITHIKVTLTLTPNFNKLAEYIGVNSNYRLYDISEKQSVDRYVNYGETCFISKYPYKCGTPMINYNGVLSYADIFKSTGALAGPRVTSAVLQGAAGRNKTADLVPCERIGLPVVSFPLGNSLVFMTQYKDNYGAGFQSSNDYEDEGYKRVQRQVQYCDSLGNISVLDVNFGEGLWEASYSSQLDKGAANLFPAVSSDGSQFRSLIGTLGDPLYISKDSRERIILVYQLHHQTSDKNIVIGSMLTQRNPLIGGYKGTAGKLYFLPNKLNELDDIINLTGAIEANTDISDIIQIDNDNRIRVGSFINNADFTAKSWALIDEQTRRLYIGENLTIPPNGLTDMLFFNFMDNAALKAQEPA